MKDFFDSRLSLSLSLPFFSLSLSLSFNFSLSLSVSLAVLFLSSTDCHSTVFLSFALLFLYCFVFLSHFTSYSSFPLSLLCLSLISPSSSSLPVTPVFLSHFPSYSSVTPLSISPSIPLSLLFLFPLLFLYSCHSSVFLSHFLCLPISLTIPLSLSFPLLFLCHPSFSLIFLSVPLSFYHSCLVLISPSILLSLNCLSVSFLFFSS